MNEIRYKLGKIANAAHNHPADPEKQSIRDAIEKLKNLAGMENPLITREAVDQSRATINMAARANAPSTSAMSRTYQSDPHLCNLSKSKKTYPRGIG